MKRTITLLAWIVTLLVSELPDILYYELGGAAPLWLLWVKLALLAVVIGLGWLWKPIRALRPYFIMLLALAMLMKLNSLLLSSPAWMSWQNGRSFSGIAIAAQALEMGVALALIGVLFLLRKRRERFFLVRGDLHPVAEPVRLFGQKSPGSLARFGFIFTAVVIVGQVFILIVPLSPSADLLRKLIPLIPLILLLAAWNGFTEEVILRAAPIAPVYEVVGKSPAIWMAATLFGLAHYLGGVPSGAPGVLITALLGWFFGKCMLDSKGFCWPWLFHALQDILPFTLMALAAVGSG
jgi:membrane protease YdiL (CAAX protease family)